MKKSAKKVGNDFERQFKKLCQISGIVCARIPDEIRNHYGKGRAIHVKTPFDFALGINGKAVFLDAKACGDDKWNFKSRVFADEKVHQYESLLHCWNLGSQAGYLVHFYNQNILTWVPVERISVFVQSGINSITPTTEGLNHINLESEVDIKRLFISNS